MDRTGLEGVEGSRWGAGAAETTGRRSPVVRDHLYEEGKPYLERVTGNRLLVEREDDNIARAYQG